MSDECENNSGNGLDIESVERTAAIAISLLQAGANFSCYSASELGEYMIQRLSVRIKAAARDNREDDLDA